MQPACLRASVVTTGMRTCVCEATALAAIYVERVLGDYDDGLIADNHALVTKQVE